MSQSNPRTFSSDFKRFFVRGLVVLLPSILTLWIVVQAYRFIDNNIAEPINVGIQAALGQSAKFSAPLREMFDPSQERLTEGVAEAVRSAKGTVNREAITAQVRGRLRAENIRTWWDVRWYMDLIGLVVAIISVYIAGRLLGGFVGRSLYRKVEDLITSLPVFKQVYPSVKQVVDFLFGSEKIKFNRVVVVEYPRKGIWSVGFMTGDTMRAIKASSGDSVTVFIPSSPTPFTGYTITVPATDIRELPITVDEALRFTVSGGVLVPTSQVDTENRSTLIPIPPAADARDVGDDPPDAREEPSAADSNQSRRDAG